MSSFDRPAFCIPCASSSLFLSHSSPSFCSTSNELTSDFHRSCLISQTCRGIGFPRTTHSLEINNAAWRRCVCGTGQKPNISPSRHLDTSLPPFILPPATLVPEYPYAPPPLLYTRACLLSTRSSHLCPPSLSASDSREHVSSGGIAASASVCRFLATRGSGCCASDQSADRRVHSA